MAGSQQQVCINHMKETKVIEVVVDPSAAVTKGFSIRGKVFAVEATAKLADGTEVKYHIDSERKKNLPRAIERDQESAKAGAMKASFNEKGEFWGMVKTYMIGGSGGLTPQA